MEDSLEVLKKKGGCGTWRCGLVSMAEMDQLLGEIILEAFSNFSDSMEGFDVGWLGDCRCETQGNFCGVYTHQRAFNRPQPNHMRMRVN